MIVVENRADEEIETRRLENGGENVDEGIEIGGGQKRGAADGLQLFKQPGVVCWLARRCFMLFLTVDR